MTAVDQVHRTLGGGHISGLFARAYGTIAGWNNARVTRKALSALTDHELADIGLQRGDIDFIR